MSLILQIRNSALLAGKKVGFYSEFPTDGELPEGLVRCDEYGNPVSSMDDSSEEETQKSSGFNGTGTDCTNIDCGVAVTVHTSCNPFISTTQVVPKCLTLGMGCRKDKDARGIAEAAQKVLDMTKQKRRAIFRSPLGRWIQFVWLRWECEIGRASCRERV